MKSKIKATLTLVVLLGYLVAGETSVAAVQTGYTGSPASFVFSALDPSSGKTFYKNLNLDYASFLQNPSAEINLSADPNLTPLIGKANVTFNVTAFAPLKDDLSNQATWGVLTTSRTTAAQADSSWIGIDLLRQTLQVFFSYLTDDSGWITAGSPGSFNSLEWSNTLLGRVPFDTTGTPQSALSFYYLNNPTGDPKGGVIRKAGEWTLGLDGWLRFSNGHSLLANQAPIANAGKDQTVIAGKTVTLSGIKSYDPDESPAPLTYFWSQTSGPSVALQNPGAQTASFIANTIGNYSFTLTVSDGKDQGSTRVNVTSKGFTASIPSTFRIKGTGNNPISWSYSPDSLKATDPIVISYSSDNTVFRKVGQSSVKKGSFVWKPSGKLAEGTGIIRVCSKSFCDQSAVSLVR